MQRHLSFDGDNLTHQAYYVFLRDAFLGRGGQLSQPQPAPLTKDDRRSEARIKTSLDGLGTVEGDGPKPGQADLRPRSLRAEGGTLALDQPDFARLQRYVETTAWLPHVVDIIVELEDWLDSAERTSATPLSVAPKRSRQVS